MSQIDELERLHKLHQSGALSAEEYNNEKLKLLAQLDGERSPNSERRWLRSATIVGILAVACLFMLSAAAWMLFQHGNEPNSSLRKSEGLATAVSVKSTQAIVKKISPLPPMDPPGANEVIKPGITAVWLSLGSWVEEPSDYRLACDTEGVTFKSDGRFSDGAGYGKYRTDGVHITYFNRVLQDEEGEGVTEDRSEFNHPKKTKVVWMGPNKFKEDGSMLYRCNGG